MKAAIYCRVSTEDQEREGTSLQSQLEACKKLAQEQGYDVSEGSIVMETYSGLSFDRPKLNEVRQWVRDKEVDAVVAYTLDRLSRDPIHFIILQDEFDKHEVELFLVTESIDSSDVGKLITHIKGYAAKLEALKIRERTLRGLKERAKSGRLVGGRNVHLFGYDYLMGEGKRVINERQSQMVRDMFRWLAEGDTVNGVTLRLIELGIPTPTGKSRWNTSTVHKILVNRAYIGDPKPYHGIVITNSTPPLVSEELFNQVQARLKQNERMASRNTRTEFLLRGHILCTRCHRKYYASQPHRRDRYYYCAGKLKIITSHKCENKTYKADYLEKVVWEHVEELLVRPEIIFSEIERRRQEINLTKLTGEMHAVEKRLIELDGQQAELLSWALKGFPEETVTKENLKINQYRENLNNRLADLQARLTEARENEVDLEGIKHFCKLASENLANFNYAEKRLAIEALQIEVWLDGKDISITGVIPSCDIASTQRKPGHRGWLSLYYHKSPYIA